MLIVYIITFKNIIFSDLFKTLKYYFWILRIKGSTELMFQMHFFAHFLGIVRLTLPTYTRGKDRLLFERESDWLGQLKINFVLPPFGNIRCFSFTKWIYLDIF
jgi:hypothetical protein